MKRVFSFFIIFICIIILSIHDLFSYSIFKNNIINDKCFSKSRLSSEIFSIYHPSKFHKNMEYLLNRINNNIESKERFTFYLKNETIISKMWSRLFLTVLGSYPEFFITTSKIINNEKADFDVDKVCFNPIIPTNGRIVHGYTFSNRLNMFPIPLEDLNEYNVSASTKTGTEIMCRRMDKSIVLQCPTTFLFVNNIVSEKDEFFNYIFTHPNTSWLFKPAYGLQGLGILLSDDINELIDYSKKEGGVIQQILDNPFLYNGRRFSMRIHAIITSFDPYIFYYAHNNYNFYLASLPSDENDPGEVISNDHYHYDEVNIVDTEKVVKYFSKHGLLDKWFDYSIPEIGRGLNEFLRQMDIKSEGNQTKFLFYGCDILLDDKLRPYLLECNLCPGIFELMKAKATLFEELIYILLHQEYFGVNDTPPDIFHWNRI